MTKTAIEYAIYTHDSWGTVKVGHFQGLEEARQAFTELCQDPWYRQDGGVIGLELAEDQAGLPPQRLAWFGFR